VYGQGWLRDDNMKELEKDEVFIDLTTRIAPSLLSREEEKEC
jgi:hypothetical protein